MTPDPTGHPEAHEPDTPWPDGNGGEEGERGGAPGTRGVVAGADPHPIDPTGAPAALDGAALAPIAESEEPKLLGKAVGHGMSWIFAGTVLSKLAAFVTQFVLGWLLIDKDFGLYMTSLAVAGMVGVFRDGGVREFIVQRGEREYEGLIGPVFWMGLALSVACGLVLAAASPAVAWFYEEPRLVAMLLVIAASIPVSTPASIMQCKLRIQMRFADLSRITIVSALVRSAATIGFAAALPEEHGALAFVLPLIVIALFEWGWTYRLVRERPWKRPAEPGRWWGLFKQTKWLVLSALSGIVLDFGPFAVAGRIIDQKIVGQFAFANQWVAQIGVLLSFNFQQVLFPTLTRLGDQPERLREASLRALRALMLAGSVSSVGLAVVAAPMESFLWGGKWAKAVGALQVLGVIFPFRVTFGLTAAIMLAGGHFKRYFWLTLMEGTGICIGAGIGAAVFGNATGIAACAGGAMALGRLVVTMILLGGLGVPIARVVGAFMSWWLLAVGAGAAAIGVDRWLAVGDRVTPWAAARLPERRIAGIEAARLSTMAGDMAEGLLLGGVCGVVFLVGARLLMPGQLVDALNVAPGRIARPVKRLLRLR
ncbi:MAG: oligosaccharide flippase family protein [Phycisphaerales bacterium]|nr:oligosaccharide flippase family protein [Phycisphaerales bacterium]